MDFKIAVLKGDGIGPEIVNEFVYDQSLTIHQCRPHRRSFNQIQLDDEITDKQSQSHRDQNRNDPVFDFFPPINRCQTNTTSRE